MKITKRNSGGTSAPNIETIPVYQMPTCDRCGLAVEAKYRVAVGADGMLDFCNHCFQRYVTTFIQRGWKWIRLDEE
jgi:hypothetical protein